jgi:uncharacterized membrane protein YcaP (DUF421 family)
MLTSGSVLLSIVARTATIYLLVLLGVRLTGKREVGQMTPFDLTLLLLISNAVQNAMTGPDTSLAGGAVAATTLLVLNYAVAELSGRNRRFRRIVEGEPCLLIHNGEMILPHMSREHVTVDEIERALREHGIANVREVSMGVLEVDGSISLLRMNDMPEHWVKHHKRFLTKSE